MWQNNGDATCDHCPRTYPAAATRHITKQRLLAAGWHHWEGLTLTGEKTQVTICPHCLRDERRTTRTKVDIPQDTLPGLENITDDTVGRNSGVSSR